jgi:hypothetical protein
VAELDLPIERRIAADVRACSTPSIASNESVPGIPGFRVGRLTTGGLSGPHMFQWTASHHLVSAEGRSERDDQWGPRPAAHIAARFEDSTGPALPGHSGQPAVESVGIRASSPAEMRVGTHQHDLSIGISACD